MRRRYLIPVVPLVLAAAVAVAIPADAPPELTKKSEIYAAAIAQEKDRHLAGLETLHTQYAAMLAKALTSYQEKGLLDGLLKTREEQERFKREQTLPRAVAEGTPSELARAQTRYINLAAKTAATHEGEIRSLAERYVKHLDALKRELTASDRIGDAFIVKAEIDRIRAAEAEEESTVSLAACDRQCPQCAGKGRIEVTCVTCGGGGNCGTCNGLGTVAPRMKGSRTRSMCLKCSGKKRCRVCSASGELLLACPLCRGTGKTPAGAEINITATTHTPEMPGTDPGDKPVDNRTARTGTSARHTGRSTGLNEYVATMATLSSSYRGGDVKKADLARVTNAPKRFVKNVLSSDVYMVLGHPRSVKVVADRESPAGTAVLLVPYDLKVGMKAERVFGSVGMKGRVRIVYGVVGEDSFTLFDIQSP